MVAPNGIIGPGRRVRGPAVAAFRCGRPRGARIGARGRGSRSRRNRPRGAALRPGVLGGRRRRTGMACLDWSRLDDPQRRRQKEQDDLGTDLGDLGRRLAERWGCDPLVVDAAWLHADHGALNAAATSPDRLAIIQEAYRRAEQTPWSIGRPDHESTPSEPRLRILMAEVQARCIGAFVDSDATPHEERMTRQNARLRGQLTDLRESQGRGDRFLQLLAESTPSESPEEWADRAAMTWCAEPEVSAARVVWLDSENSGARSSPSPKEGPETTTSQSEMPSAPTGVMGRPPTVVLPLCSGGRTHASIELWCPSELTAEGGRRALPAVRRAWESWAALLADRRKAAGAGGSGRSSDPLPAAGGDRGGATAAGEARGHG